MAQGTWTFQTLSRSGHQPFCRPTRLPSNFTLPINVTKTARESSIFTALEGNTLSADEVRATEQHTPKPWAASIPHRQFQGSSTRQHDPGHHSDNAASTRYIVNGDNVQGPFERPGATFAPNSFEIASSSESDSSKEQRCITPTAKCLLHSIRHSIGSQNTNSIGHPFTSTTATSFGKPTPNLSRHAPRHYLEQHPSKLHLKQHRPGSRVNL